MPVLTFAAALVSEKAGEHRHRSYAKNCDFQLLELCEDHSIHAFKWGFKCGLSYWQCFLKLLENGVLDLHI